jgi:hypothetical protein
MRVIYDGSGGGSGGGGGGDGGEKRRLMRVIYGGGGRGGGGLERDLLLGNVSDVQLSHFLHLSLMCALLLGHGVPVHGINLG